MDDLCCKANSLLENCTYLDGGPSPSSADATFHTMMLSAPAKFLVPRGETAHLARWYRHLSCFTEYQKSQFRKGSSELTAGAKEQAPPVIIKAEEKPRASSSSVSYSCGGAATALPEDADAELKARVTKLFGIFNQLKLRYETLKHPPVMTCDAAEKETGHLPGGHCKNLFMKSKKGEFFLFSALAETPVNIKDLKKKIGAKGDLRFADADALYEHLHVRPGGVTLFSIMNDPEHKVKLLLDANMMKADPLNFHPLHNAATTTMPTDDVLKFVKHIGHDFMVIE